MRSLLSISPAQRALLLIWLLPLGAVIYTLLHAPAWLQPRQLRIDLPPGQSVQLGRETLAAAHADTQHLLIQRTEGGMWQLANLAAHKQVLWQAHNYAEERSTREWRLTPGATFSIGAHRFEVLRVRPGRVVLQTQQQRWTYDGFRLRLDGRFLPECYPHWRALFRERIAVWLGKQRGWQRPLRFGGGVYCADRLGLDEVPIDAALLNADAQGFVLQVGNPPGVEQLPLQVSADQAHIQSLRENSITLQSGDRLIIGRTHYQVASAAARLDLDLVARAWRWTAGQLPTLPHGLHIEWQSASSLLPVRMHGLYSVLGLVLGGMVLMRIPKFGAALAALAFAAACCALYAQRATAPILWSYTLAWTVLGLWLQQVRSPWSRCLFGGFTLLAGIGLVSALQLAVGAAESSWSQYGGGAAALLGVWGWLAWCALRIANYAQTMQWGLRWHWKAWAVRILSVSATVLLLTQLLWGDESGWSGFQPFELTKLALVIAAAYGLAAQRSCHAAPQPRTLSDMLRRWLSYLRYLLPMLLLIILSAFALTFLRDFSPLLLLICWFIGLLWAWIGLRRDARQRHLGRWCILAIISMALVGLALLHRYPELFPLSIQGERIQVWAALEQHPHTGYQLRRALEAIQIGGWWGTLWAEPSNGWLMNLPALQDDFMPTFLLNRYGGWSALLLASIQAMFVGTLLAIGRRSLVMETRAPTQCYAIDWGRFSYFALYGGASLLAAHFVVSWGTNLGLLPVMGQPMSLLSNAGSHLTLFVLPIMGLAVAVEEYKYGKPSGHAGRI